MTYPVLGLCGTAGVGKDTAADYLIEKYGGTKIAFASPLKSLAAKFFPHENVYGPSEKRNEVVPVPAFESGNPPIGQNTFDLIGGDPKVVEEWCMEILTEYHWEGGMSARHFLQRLGTDLGRKVNPNIWVSKGVQTAKAALGNGANFVVFTDVRFKNEALAIKEMGGKLCRIYGESVATGNDSHVSETEVSTIPGFWYDIHLHNPKTSGFRSVVESVLDPHVWCGAKNE